MPLRILLRGGGDLASGVAYRLARAGCQVIITELPQPLAVRRLVSFSEAVYEGSIVIEGVEGARADRAQAALELARQGKIAVLVDQAAESRGIIQPHVLIDGRMMKQPPELGKGTAPLVIGLGPGFVAGESCDAVVETKRGNRMGRVYWHGAAEADTGMPESVGNRRQERVLRSPCAGRFISSVEICAMVEEGQVLAEVNGCAIRAQFQGILRGLLHSGVEVAAGVKVGDIDPRADPDLCMHFSDKALAVGGGVLEAILSYPELRQFVCS